MQKRRLWITLTALVLLLILGSVTYRALSRRVKPPEEMLTVPALSGRTASGAGKQEAQERTDAAGEAPAEQTPEDTSSAAAEDENAPEQQDEGETQQEQQPERQLLPDFSVLDEDGNTVSLSDFRGMPVVVNFWATWCPHCVNELPGFDAVWEEYGDEVQFLIIDLTDGGRETVEMAKAYKADHGYSFPIFFDEGQKTAMAYGVSAIPMTILIDREGRLAAYARGAVSEEVLRREVEKLVGETAENE